MEHEQLTRLAQAAINCAMSGDGHGAATALMEIGHDEDPFTVYAACCGFAAVGKAALTTFYGDRAPDPARGGMWAMQILDPTRSDPAQVFASRFIIAYANDDKEQAPALFRAALESSDAEYVSSVAQLLATAVGLSRTAARTGARP